jgi:aminoglycoside phosphotransferase (APT) family kinase protein
MQFVHGIEIPNGSVFVVDLHAKPVSFQALEFKQSVPVSDETITFYEQGMQDHTHTTIEEKITASENRVFHLTNHHDCLLKIMKEKEIVSSERIVHIYKYLKKKTDIHAPEIMLYDKSHIFFSDTVAIQDYQKGIDQGELLKEKKCRKPLLSLSFDTLQKIHAIPVKEVEEFWYPDDTWHKVHIPWHVYIAEEIDLTIKSLNKSIENETLRDAVKKSLNWLRDYTQSGKAQIVPLHGDFAPQNIVVSKGNEMRILDFERARIGDRIWDYAYYYGWLQRSDKEAADYWCELVQGKFTPDEQKVYHAFTVLFHAWTVRDIYDYKKNSLRAKRAEKSLTLLKSLF